MNYERALDEVIEDVRSGRGAEAAIARHREFEAQLRADAELALAVNESHRAVPIRQGAPERMQGRMLAELASARALASRPSGAWRGWSLFGGGPWAFGGALGLAAVMAVAVLVATGTLFGSASTAEAAFDGVVLENDAGTLTVQTAQGIEKVAASASTSTGSVPAGTFVRVQGLRQKNGTVVLNAITQAALTDWCDGNADQCLQLHTLLQNQVQVCQQNKAACAAVAERLQELQQELETHTRQLIDLESRCQQGNGDACQRLRTFCASHTSLCTHLKRAGGIGKTLLTRLQELRTACANDSTKCTQLRVFCGQHPDVCSAVQKDLQDLQDSLRNRRPSQ